MKKAIGVFIIFILLLLAACEQTPALSETEEPSAGTQAEATAAATETLHTDAPVETDAPLEEATQPPQESGGWQDVYKSFLSENYEGLIRALDIGVAGVGFIDLDLNEIPELVLFDAGASEAMGVQIFMINGDTVECVSANIAAVGEQFGASELSHIYVNAREFADFRLMESISGDRFFCVISSNGALDFGYSELIRFSGDGAGVTLSRVLYKYEEYDTETGEILLERFENEYGEIYADEYAEELEYFATVNHDVGYTAAGAYIWENSAFVDEFDGFMAMTEQAIKLYTQP